MTNKQKILIVEDDIDISESLLLFLQAQGYKTLAIDDGDKVIDAVKNFKPDLIILDITLPNLSGIECCKRIRQFSNVPIIMLTAKVTQDDKNLGLGVGADDYLCKPFDIKELILRCKVKLERTAGTVTFSTLSNDTENSQVLFKGKPLELSALEYNLFNIFYHQPKRIFSREQLLDLAYTNERYVTDRTIDSHVKKIRKKFKEAGIDESPIESVYGAGYRYAL
ncbi:response regulator [Paraferrimonas haliotis]|uniref:DNA-binding response regulator n=1 Tax=Paraferrimonas haliotis TaxID=2013866 RepID=A0AA37TW08_9GAMM|nr:response regulator [Paraferrimonas haliotis]GLS84781.1 DNA-binding response regulator [Paraferrimonas haliotis]